MTYLLNLSVFEPEKCSLQNNRVEFENKTMVSECRANYFARGLKFSPSSSNTGWELFNTMSLPTSHPPQKEILFFVI